MVLLSTLQLQPALSENLASRNEEKEIIELGFDYQKEKLVPSALPDRPINEETKMQYGLSVEDLKKIASISDEDNWRFLLEQLNNYQSAILQDRKNVTLDEAITIALAENPSIKESKFDVLASIWSIRAESRRWMPSITLDSGSVGYYKDYLYVNSRKPKNPDLGSGSVSSYKSDYFQAYPEVSISWDALDPERGPSIMIAKRTEEVDKLLLNYAVRSLVVDVYEKYTQIEILLEQIDAYSKLVALEVSIADGIYEVYKQGLTSIGEVAKWRSQTYSSISELIGYYQQLNEAYSELSTALGSEGYFPYIPEDKKIYISEWKLTLEESIKKAVNENEKIKSKYIQSDISNIKTQRLINSYLPKLTISASASNQVINGIYQAPLYQTPPALPTSKQDTTSPIYQVYAGVTINFDGGINLARANAERMRAKSEEFTADQTKNDVIERVRTSYFGLYNRTLNLESTQRAVQNSKLSLAVYKQRFMAGLTDTTPFLQAVNLYTTSIIARSRVKEDVISNYVNLLRATATWPKEFEISLDQAIENIMDKKDI